MNASYRVMNQLITAESGTGMMAVFTPDFQIKPASCLIYPALNERTKRLSN